jgi:hypothetical protein
LAAAGTRLLEVEVEIERHYEEATGRLALYAHEWDLTQTPAKKANRSFPGYEQPVQTAQQHAVVVREAICWSYGRTLGNIAVSNEDLLGRFPAQEGNDAAMKGFGDKRS